MHQTIMYKILEVLPIHMKIYMKHFINVFYIISFICETDFTLLVPIKHIIVIIFDVDWFVNKGRNGAAEDKAS